MKPTFISKGNTLFGEDAITAWKDQNARCNCNAVGDPNEAVYGTCNGLEATWLGCPYCIGSAVGRPLVFKKV